MLKTSFKEQNLHKKRKVMLKISFKEQNLHEKEVSN